MPGKLSSSAAASRLEIRDFRLTPQINLGGFNFGLKFFGLHNCCQGLYSYLSAVFEWGENFRKQLSYKQPFDFTQKTHI